VWFLNPIVSTGKFLCNSALLIVQRWSRATLCTFIVVCIVYWSATQCSVNCF